LCLNFQFEILEKVTAENGRFWQTKKGCRFVVYLGVNKGGGENIEEHLDIAAEKQPDRAHFRYFGLFVFGSVQLIRRRSI